MFASAAACLDRRVFHGFLEAFRRPYEVPLVDRDRLLLLHAADVEVDDGRGVPEYVVSEMANLVQLHHSPHRV
jgi:hypothetical protein